jgi:hypothetical protein
MPQNMALKTAAILKGLTLTLIASCDSQDRRIAEYAQRAAEQQARQNERMVQQSEAITKQSQEVTSAAHKLVEQDASARRDLIQAQDKLQEQYHAERLNLDRQRQQLDTERKAAAQAAVRDPVIAQAIITAGLFLAALLPMIVTLYALRRLPEQRPVDELLGDPLIDSIVTGAIGAANNDGRASLPDSAIPPLLGPSGHDLPGGNHEATE